MVKKGFRVPPQKSKGDQFNELRTELANMQMAGRISQMMTQQLMQSVQTMSQDLGAALNHLYELQYKYEAVTKHLKLDEKTLTDIANAQRLIDFDEASAKQDARDGLLNADVVSAESTVTITSVATDEKGKDRGIFRSRLKLSESGVPELNSALDGKKVGEKVPVKLNGVDHEVELLAIRNPSQAEAQPETAH